LRDLSPPVAIGDVIDGKYRIERVVGSGGMGVVMAAEHLKLGKTVALKFLLRHACENREAVARFLREARALASITSTHVAHVMDVGTLAAGEPYLVMEYLEGSDLGAALKLRGPLPIAEAVGYVIEACEAVAEAHANGIVHRDLKPSNLFLTRTADGVPLVKVLDFGISKAVVQRAEMMPVPLGPAATTAPAAYVTDTGALVGSPAYMSPEQIRNARRVDERTDIWAFGVILYELLTGSPPFDGETLAGTLAAVSADTPKSMRQTRTEIPAELELVILRCLQKAPEQRFGSLAELAVALEPFAPNGGDASVQRIMRLLGVPSPSPNAQTVSGTGADESAATVPSWEGNTVTLHGLIPTLKRRAWVLGLFAAALAAGFVLTRAPAPPPAPAASLAADASLLTREPVGEAMPEPSAAVAQPRPASSVAPGAALSDTATARTVTALSASASNAPPLQAKPRPHTERQTKTQTVSTKSAKSANDEGTEDRK
jgi:serine/threonine-protein kinase